MIAPNAVLFFALAGLALGVTTALVGKGK